MQKPRLNKKQRELVAEIKQLMSRLALDPDEIVLEVESEALTTHLEMSKDRVIRSAVMFTYVLMDEYFSAVICWHFFGKKRTFQQLWRTKRFQTFNYFVLEKLYLLQKLELVESIHDIPGWVSSDLRKLNDLRNGIAHSFFPENRRRKPEWKGQSVFTTAGFDRFLEDMEKLREFVIEHFWAGTPEDTGDRPDIGAANRALL